jgi:hypothetical protein
VASQFDTEKVVLQPTQQEAPLQTNVFEQGAQIAAQQSAVAQQDASRQGSRMSQLYSSAINTATAGFDRVLSAYNQYAEQKAIEEAPAIIQRDGNNQIIPPSSFYPTGLHTMAYAQAFHRAAVQVYRESAANDYANYSAEMKAKYPNDTAGYTAEMDKRRDFMLTGLADDQRPYMDLRFRGISGQALSQIAVSQQAAKNDVMAKSYGDQMTGITNNMVKMSGIFSGPGAAPAAAPGMIPSVMQGLPPSIQQRASFDRTPARNAEVGGAPDSQHLRPNSAADIDTKGMPEPERLQLIQSVMANPHVRGLGFYGDHIHIDTDRTARVTWGTPPAELKGHVEQWKAQPAPGGGMSSTDVAGDVTRMRAWLNSNDPNAVIQRDAIIGANATGTQAGVPQAKHDQLLNDMALKAVLGAKAEQIKATIFRPGTDSIIDPAQVVEERNKIRAYAATDPVHKDLIEQTLTQALEYKIQQSNSMAQSHNLNSQRVGDAKIRDLSIRAREADLNPDPIAQAEAKRGLKLESLAILQDRNLSDSQAMRVAGAATQASGMAQSALQESNDKRLQGLVSTIQSLDPMVGPDKKEAARVELSTIMHDPTIYKDLTVSQREYGQNALNKVVAQQIGNDFNLLTRAVEAGVAGPAEVDAFVDRGIKNSTIGPHGIIPLDQALRLSAQAKINYATEQEVSRMAASGMQRNAAGLTPSPEEVEAIRKKMPFLLPEERVGDIDPFFGSKERARPIRFDPANPEHMTAYADYKRLTGITPESVKRAVEEMNRSPDQDKMQGLLDVYRVEYDLIGERMRKANRGVEPTVAQLQSEVKHSLGDNATYLSLALNTSAQTAFEDWQSSVGTSVTAAQGQPTQPATQSMADAFTKLAGEIQPTANGSTFMGKLMQGRIPWTSGWNDTAKEREVNQVFAGSPQSSAPTTIGQAIPLFAGKNYESVIYDDDVKARLVSLGLLEQTRNGQLNQRMLGRQGASEKAARDVMTNMFNDGLIEMVPDQNGKDGRIKFRTWQSIVGAGLGVPNISAKAAQDYANQFIYADARQKTLAAPNGKMLPPFDPTQTVVFSITEADGSRYLHFGSVDSVTGRTVDLGKYSQKDPRFSAATMAAQKTAAAQLYDAWTEIGPDGKLKKPDANSLMGWGMAIETFVSAPLQSYINKNRIEAAASPGTAANTYFAEELDRNLAELERRSTGMSGSPDWRATLRKAAESDTPLSGIPQDVLRAWAKKNPAGQEPPRLK